MTREFNEFLEKRNHSRKLELEDCKKEPVWPRELCDAQDSEMPGMVGAEYLNN